MLVGNPLSSHGANPLAVFKPNFSYAGVYKLLKSGRGASQSSNSLLISSQKGANDDGGGWTARPQDIYEAEGGEGAVSVERGEAISGGAERRF